ncbi:MAG: hypothetical protein RL181_832 [Bacteroidota bacterium]|jgi:SAM-dependent methyltransferase
MFREEAKWIREVLFDLPLKGCTIVNLGSSSAAFRQVVQPHIHEEVIAPLVAMGAQITHVDMKPDEGVDIVVDLTAKVFTAHFHKRYDLVLCTNMLEHVENIDEVVENILQVAAPGSYILLTVPRRYPLHFDPIDNGFRPRPDVLAALFMRKTPCKVLKSQVISIKEPGYYPVKFSKYPLWGYRVRLKYWVGRYYKVTGVLLQKTS